MDSRQRVKTEFIQSPLASCTRRAYAQKHSGHTFPRSRSDVSRVKCPYECAALHVGESQRWSWGVAGAVACKVQVMTGVSSCFWRPRKLLRVSLSTGGAFLLWKCPPISGSAPEPWPCLWFGSWHWPKTPGHRVNVTPYSMSVSSRDY